MKRKSINKGKKTMLKLSKPSIRVSVNNVSKKSFRGFSFRSYSESTLSPENLPRTIEIYTYNDGIVQGY